MAQFIPVDSGTGPNVAVDSVGSNNFQIVKIMQAPDGTTAGLSATLAVSGNVAVVNTPLAITGTVSAVGGAAGVQYAVTTAIPSTGTGTLVIGIQEGATTARGLLIHTTGGLIIASGGGGGVQYQSLTTGLGATGTGNLILGLQATTSRALVANTSGQLLAAWPERLDATNDAVSCVQSGSWNVGIIGTVSVSGGGAGVQYTIDTTTIAATGTGNLILGIQSGATTVRGLAVTATGGIHTVQNIGTILGTVAVSGGGGGVQYPIDSTTIGATGTGNLILGIQFGATTARGLAVTTTGGVHTIQTVATVTTLLGTIAVSGTTTTIAAGTQDVRVVNTPTVTVSTVLGVVTISGTSTVLPSGTQNVTVVNTPTVTASQGGVWNIATISTLLGTVAVSGGGGGVQYPIDTTAIGATGTGNLILGIQSGATTARGLAVTTTGGIHTVQTVATVSTLLGTIAISGTASVIPTGTQNVNVVNVLSATNITVASITTGTVNVVNVLSASGVTIANITTGTVSIAGTVAVSGGGGGAQYTVDTTSIGATATGTVLLGIQSTTVRGLTLSATGDPGVRQVGTWNIATISTLLGTVAVSGGGGGAQYTVDTTSIGATGTGNLILGIQGTTAKALSLSVTGDPGVRQIGTWNIAALTTGTVNVVNVLSASGVTVASVATGTVNVVNVLSASGVTIANITTGTVSIAGTVAVSGGAAGVQYSQGDTAIAATGTGTLVMGVISGGTTAQRLVVSTSGEVNVAIVRSITTGTVSVVNVLSASGVTIASVTTGTMNVVNVLSASNVTVASVATGTMNVVNVLSASGVTVANITTGTVSIAGTVAVSGTVTPTAIASTIGHGRSTVAADATAVALTASSIACKIIHITALATNTGQIVVGGSGVAALGGTLTGIPLQQLQSIKLEIDNVNKIFINASNSSDGVSYAYLA